MTLTLPAAEPASEAHTCARCGRRFPTAAPTADGEAADTRFCEPCLGDLWRAERA